MFLSLLMIVYFNPVVAIDTKKILYIRLKPNVLEAKKFLKSTIPKDARILDLYKQTAIIEYDTPVDQDDLNKLKSLPEIERVTFDSVQEILKKTKKMPIDCINCNRSEVMVEKKVEKLEEKVEKVLEKIKDKKCELYSSCSNNSKTKLWAQIAVDGDLMLEELASLGIEKGSVKVAVLDTGFDVVGNSKNLHSPNLLVKKGVSFIEGETSDIVGHGTAVAGLIGAKDGVGLSPLSSLSVFAIGFGPDGNSSHSVSMMAIEKACDEGNEIINLSYGSLGNEDKKYFDSNLLSDRLFMDMLLKKGCLVLNSAGNNGTKNKEGLKSSLDEAVTRVESSKPNGKMAKSSSSGTVRAPGDGVFTLSSSKNNKLNDEWSKKQYGCKESDGAFISGTSFASPITAAIAANIVAVLKLSEQYKSLPGHDKIKIINRILKASEVGENVNGLRAVLIAKEWVTNTDSRPAPADKPEAFANLLLKPQKDFCASSINQCGQAQQVCVDKLKCINLLRKKMAVCENTDTSVINRLLNLAENEDNLELMLKTVNVVSNTPNQSFLETDKIWQNFVQRWSKNKNEFDSSKAINLMFNMDPEVAGPIICMMAKELKTDPNKNKILDDALRAYLFSYPLTDGLYSDEIKNNLQSTLVELIDVMGEDLFISKIENFLDNGASLETAASKVKLINFLNEEPLKSKISNKDKLGGLDRKLFNKLIKEDEYIKDYHHYTTLFKRMSNNKILDQSAGVGLEASYLELEAKVLVMDKSSAQEKISLGEKIIQHHLNKKNGAAYKVQLVLSSLEKKMKETGGYSLAAISLKEYLSTAIKKPEYIMKSLDFYPDVRDEIPSYVKSEINNSLFLNLKDACQSAYRIMATITETESKMWKDFNYHVLNRIAYLGSYKDCGKELGEFKIPLEQDASSKVELAEKVIKAGSTAEVLNKLMVKIINAYNPKTSYNYNYDLYLGLKKILSVKSLRSELADDGAGMKALYDLKIKVETNPDQYSLLHNNFNEIFNLKN